MSGTSIALRVGRYRPEHAPEPYFDEYDVPTSDDMVVLDALNYIKDRIDGSLAYRWSCRMGVCGSCGMMVNGVPRLTCSTFLREFDSGPIVVEPLQYFPVIRDLVVDMTDFLEKLRTVKPWIIRRAEKPVEEGEYLQTPREREKYRNFSMCINCLLCYAACPVYGREPEFVGPAAIALAHRYNLDSRDEANGERNPILGSGDAVWMCTFVGECSVVCPKHVDPAAAIQQEKLATAIDKMKSFLLPWGKR